MTYELCKQLKEAGYEQTGYFWITGEGEIWDLEQKPEGTIVMPTLSELIEACGDGIARLWRVDKSYDDGKTKWCATGVNDFLDGLGSTPEEAVAKLWLELQK